jgi:hypothetical protein
MATTRKKPATATKAAKVATVRAATKSAALSTRSAATAVAEAPAAAPGMTATAIATPTAPPAPTPAGIERRRSPREQLVAPAVLQPPSGDASCDRGVQVQDLSLGGVGFRATEQFTPGEIYRITLGKGPLLLNARVRIISCNKTGHRMYRCGAEFC